MALWKKVILVVGSLPIIGFFGFCLLFYTATSVGYLNFMFTYWDMRETVALAKDYPLVPGVETGVEVQDGKLVAAKFAMTRIRKDKDRLHVAFATGGGHLGNQGYYYSEILSHSTRHVDGMPDPESYRVDHLIGNWWCYDGIVD